MTEEIKRILDYLINEKAYLHYGIRREKFIELEGREVKTLLDYITNLQQLYENGLKVNQNSHKYITELEMNNTILKEDLDKANDIIKKDRQFYKYRMDEYVDLKKENQELKQTLHNIAINDVEEENTTVLDLIRENKRLKRERQRLLYNLEKVCEERDEEE